MSHTAARRAAANGVGVCTDSVSSVRRVRELTEAYLAAGGTGPRRLVIDTSATGLNLRVHVGCISREAAVERISALGEQVLPLLRAAWPAAVV